MSKPEDDPQYLEELAVLRREHADGRLSTYDYNTGRRRLLEAARARVAAAEAGEAAPAASAAASPVVAPPPAPPAVAGWPAPPPEPPVAAAPPAAAEPPAPEPDHPARPEDDPIYKEVIAALRRDHSDGKISTYEFNQAWRRALGEARERFEASRGGEAAAAPVDAPAASPTSAAAPAPAAAEPGGPSPAEPPQPAAWGERGPKYWSESGRGDDPSVRVVHPPLAEGIGTGKSFLFIFGLKKLREIDQMMVGRETAEIADDIEVLRQAGYTVVVDPQGSKQDFLQAIYGEGEGVEGLVPAGIYWSAHGFEDGGLECCDAQRVQPSDVESARVSPGLKLLVLGACYAGSWARKWRQALGNHPLVVGWGRPVTIDRAVEFLRSNPETDTDLDDLIARYLLTDTPVPPLPVADTIEAASKLGRKTEVLERVPRVADILGAAWREQEQYCELRIPLPNQRHHTIRVFVTHATQEYSEGKALVGIEAEVGELTNLVETTRLLRSIAEPGYARVALVKGRADLPDIVAQGFIPLRHATDLEIASVAYQVAQVADQLEKDIFGGDRPE